MTRRIVALALALVGAAVVGLGISRRTERDAPPPEAPRIAMAPRGAAPPTGAGQAAGEPDTQTVFFATDRARFQPDALWYATRFAGFGVALLAGWAVLRVTRTSRRPWLRRALRIAWVPVAAALLVHGAFQAVHMAQVSRRLGVLYGGERRGSEPGALPYDLGRARVSIPATHRRGEVERPSPWKGDWFEDPRRHMVVFDVTPLEEAPFFGAVRTWVGASLEGDALVFVHGYNVGFEEALQRTAQIAYDLGFQGAPILYSWPSEGRYAGYPVDETNVEWATPHLVRFLRDLRERSGARRIHLIAHSMGNRALVNALERLREAPSPARFDEVVLAAPDIDADTFREDLAPRLLPAAARVTLYASSKDLALVASKAFHGYPRAGESGDATVVVDGMDTIDVSTVSASHSYIGDNGWVLDDLGMVLLTEEPIVRRPGLRFLERVRYWVLEAVGP